MTMLLMSAMEADVEPVPGKEGWFRLTATGIVPSDYMNAIECIDDVKDTGGEVFLEAKIEGMHDERDDLEEDDPRFNYEANGNFAVTLEDGKYKMVMDVNFPEAVLFQKMVEHYAAKETA